MERKKITKAQEVNLVEPLTWHEKDGTVHTVKKFKTGKGFCVVERDGQCYVVFDPSGYSSSIGLMFAIKEKFDDLEGEEIKAGSNAS